MKLRFRASLSKKTMMTLAGLVLFLLAAAAPSYYFYTKYQETLKYKTNPDLAAIEETQDLLERVSSLIKLPKNEDPTIATISDIKQLKDQPFFADAKNGDRVLIYMNARKAIIYNPDVNQIVNVTSIDIGTPAGTVQRALRIALYNGTDTVGLTRVAQKDLAENMENVEVVLREDSKKNDYTKSLVIDLTGANGDSARSLAKLVGGKTSKLPEGEDKPEDADFLIILGTSYVE